MELERIIDIQQNALDALRAENHVIKSQLNTCLERISNIENDNRRLQRSQRREFKAMNSHVLLQPIFTVWGAVTYTWRYLTG